MNASTDAIVDELRDFAGAYPGAEFKSPFPEHMDVAVDGRTFAFLPAHGQPLSLGVKLTFSALPASELLWVERMPDSPGKAGWFIATPTRTPPPMDLLKEWIDESYRAVAGGKRVQELINLGISPPI